MTATLKKFRLSEYVKDGHLAAVIRNELAGLEPEQLPLAQEAVVEVASSGAPGTFEQVMKGHEEFNKNNAAVIRHGEALQPTSSVNAVVMVMRPDDTDNGARRHPYQYGNRGR